MERTQKWFRPILTSCLILAGLLLGPRQADAGIFEFSFQFSYSRSNYSDVDYTWRRVWGASVGYHFFAQSSVELSYSDITDRTSVGGLQNTEFNDRIYAINWVQSFLGKKFPFQPYGKLGIGQLNRDATGTYASGAQPPTQLDSLTGVLSLGFKYFFLEKFALRTEATTYLVGGELDSIDDNFAINIGFSMFL